MKHLHRWSIAAVCLTLLAARDTPAQQKTETFHPMTLGRLGQLIEQTADKTQRNAPNYWEFVYFDVHMACIADTNYDRMRIIAPIVQVKTLTSEQKDKMLAANFHSALDARYGTNDGVVYSAFIHPLSPLHEEEVRSALRQVAWLVLTFGSSYSSGTLQFGGSQNPGK